MKTKTLSFLASIAMLSFASCTDEVQELANEQSQALKQIVMTTQDFQPEAGSRTLYEIGEAIKCTWAENDTVGVFPEKGAQTYFPMASGAGTKNATFDGEGWALKDGFTYASYYPYIGKAYLDRNAVPVNYEGQTQKGNASTAHLGAFDYMVATPTTSEFGSAQFTFKHLCALVQLRIAVPQPATLTSVKLVTDTEAFAVKGEVDIMADAPGITSTKTAKEIVLNLQDVATKEENQVVTLYMMIPPVDLSEQTLKAVIVTDLGTQEIAFEGKNFKAGTAYGLSGEMESAGAGYKDGVVTITEAGTMKQLLGDDCLNITSLKVEGPINGDDVRCLRQMLGGSEFSDTEKGKLISLDLSEASIVEGGEWYYENSVYSPSVQYYTSNNVIGERMFSLCKGLKEMLLPDNVVSIGSSAFSSCTSLNYVKISDKVTLIDGYAFANCSSLNSVNLGNGVTSINDYAFQGCNSLTSVYITDLLAWCQIDFSYYYSNPLHKGAKLYLDNEELTELVIPKGLAEIKQNAFEGCQSILKITMGDDVTSIGQSAFKDCDGLSSIIIGNGVTRIYADAFYDCDALISIDIPDNVTSLGNYTFCKCDSLTSVTIGDGVTHIGAFAFRSCDALISVVIGDGVTSIGQNAFNYCSSLTSVTIGISVASIGERAFYDCKSLTRFNCYATKPPHIVSSFYESFGDKTTLYVPKGCSWNYKSSSWGKYFQNIIEME